MSCHLDGKQEFNEKMNHWLPIDLTSELSNVDPNMAASWDRFLESVEKELVSSSTLLACWLNALERKSLGRNSASSSKFSTAPLISDTASEIARIMRDRIEPMAHLPLPPFGSSTSAFGLMRKRSHRTLSYTRIMYVGYE